MEVRQVYKILIADDEPDVVSLVKDYFELNGYLVITAKNGSEAVEQASKQPDIILLDINMPEADGLEVCRRIRDYVSCPIVFLTARIEDSDKVSGFAAGGDDYIIKPFSLDELGARVAAHIRRDNRSSSKRDILLCGSLSVDYGNMTVTSGGEDISLAKKEFQILELLSRNSGQVYDKERIYEKVWGYDAEGDSYTCSQGQKLNLRRESTELQNGRYVTTAWYRCESCSGCPVREKCCQAKNADQPKELRVNKTLQELRRASLENITSDYGIYLRQCRSIQVEGAFGLLKNDFGFRRFLTRGRKNIRTELFFLALAFDLKKLWMKRDKGRLRTHLSEISAA